LKEDERPVKSLTEQQIKKLLMAFESYPAMKMRILLALGTGLRRGDIDTLKVSDVDFANCNLTTQSKKTRKSMGARPVPKLVMNKLKQYLDDLSNDQDKLFSEEFNYKQWRKICAKTGLAGLKFHDLRRTFASTMAQNGVSTAVTQRLLEHSSPILTNKIYTNVDPVLRKSIDQIPIENWLER
jgi:integrase